MKSTKSTIRFSAQIESNNLLPLPKNASTKLPSRDMMKAEGTINNFPFQATLEPNGKGSHSLKVSKEMYDSARIDNEQPVPVEITRAGEEIETRIPTEFTKALKDAPKALALWNDITPIARRDWIFWIITAKQEETRKRRIEVACSKLSGGMRRVCCFPGVSWLMKNGKK